MPDMIYNRRFKRIVIIPELMADLFKSGIHKYEVIENAIPNNGRVTNVNYDLTRDEFVLIIQSSEFPEVEAGSILPILHPVVRGFND